MISVGNKAKVVNTWGKTHPRPLETIESHVAKSDQRLRRRRHVCFWRRIEMAPPPLHTWPTFDRGAWKFFVWRPRVFV